jgi:hypothetical protein
MVLTGLASIPRDSLFNRMNRTNQKQKLLALLSILLIAGFLTTSLTSYFVSVSATRKHIISSALPLTSDTIYSEIQRDLLRPVFISSLMANDTFLQDWLMGGEADATRISKYLKEIKEKYQTFSSFLVSEDSKRYYYGDGVLKVVNPNVPRDGWYFRVRDMDALYEINVDPDMANRDAPTVFVNHKIHDHEGRYIGATGVGLTIDSIASLMEQYGEKYQRAIYFVNSDGRIVLRSRAIATDITRLQDLEGLSSIADKILSSERTSFRIVRDVGPVHLNTRLIPELHWHLIVEQAEGPMTAAIFEALIINLILCGLVTLIVLGLTYASIGIYQNRIDRMFVLEQTLYQEATERKDMLEEKNIELETALGEVKKLSGLLPICAGCKRIREGEGYWKQVELYISENSEAKFSHGICPECTKKYYPELAEDVE